MGENLKSVLFQIGDNGLQVALLHSEGIDEIPALSLGQMANAHDLSSMILYQTSDLLQGCVGTGGPDVKS